MVMLVSFSTAVVRREKDTTYVWYCLYRKAKDLRAITLFFVVFFGVETGLVWIISPPRAQKGILGDRVHA